MKIDETRQRREPTEEDVAFVGEQMRAGVDQETIARGLEERGLDRVQARNVVETVHPELARIAEAERYSPSALGPAIAGGSSRRSSAASSGD